MRRCWIGLLVFSWVVFFAGVSFALSVASKDAGKNDVPPSAGLSHVRVVRLSFVQGTVAVRRPGSDEWASASVNTPIEEGFTVATGANSFAEIEFENAATFRLGALSSVDFTELALSAQGGRINDLSLNRGYATFHVIPDHHDEYRLNVAGVTVTPQGKAEFRADVNKSQLRLEVFSGEVQAADAAQTEKIGKNHALALSVGSGAQFQASDKIEQDSWDRWSRARDQQASLAFDDSAVGLNGALYGWDDLDAYGDWGYFPGFGYGWAPYEPVGWSPYAAGMWSWYPSWGYTWISGEPWGWLPFHYGYWNFSPAMGWFWSPGSFAAWSPVLVNWYSGPGWIGWAPVGPGGVGGAAPCTLAVASCMTAVPPGVLRTGQPIRAGGPYSVRPSATDTITQVAHPDVVPERSAMLSGQPFSGAANTAQDASASALFTRGAGGAPSSVVMGKQITTEAFFAHHGSFGGGNEPIHVRLGGAMGGQPPLAAGAPAGRGPMAMGKGAGSASQSAARAQILSHASFSGENVGPGGFGGQSGGAPGVVHSGGAGSPGMSGGTAGGMHSSGGHR